MRIAQIELTRGRMTAIPDAVNWRNLSRHGGHKVGEYYGSDDTIEDYGGEWPIVELTYRTRVRPGEVIKLMGRAAYAKVFRAAYPPGQAQADDEALVFLEQARFPTSADGMIDVTSLEMAEALAYFEASNYVHAENAARVMQGVPE